MNTLSFSRFVSFSLSFPGCCQCRFKRYIAKQKNSKNWRKHSVVTSASFPGDLSAFFSFLFRCGKPQITWFFLSFFLSLKITTKNIRDLTVLSVFLSFFLFFFLFHFHFSFFKDYNKNGRDITFRSFFLSFSLFFFLSFFLNIKLSRHTNAHTEHSSFVCIPLNNFEYDLEVSSW